MLTQQQRKPAPKPPSTDLFPAWRYNEDGRSRIIKSAAEEEDGWANKPFPAPPPPPDPEDPKLEAAKLRIELYEQRDQFSKAYAALTEERNMAQDNAKAAADLMESMTADNQQLQQDVERLNAELAEAHERLSSELAEAQKKASKKKAE